MSTGLQIKVITSSGNTKTAEGLESAFNSWIEEEEEASSGSIDIYNIVQTESVVNSTPRITLTIFYKIIT